MLWLKPILIKAARGVATCGGVGFWRPAPGTWGSLVALPFLWATVPYFWLQLVVLLVVLVMGGWATQQYLAQSGSSSDPSEVVIDEFAGIWIALIGIPFSSVGMVGLGFFLFRLLDIAKPFPISWLDRSVKGALGVMVDDVVAGLLVRLLLQVFIFQGEIKLWF